VLPLLRKFFGLVELDATGVIAFRNHVAAVFREKHIGVREVEALFENDLAIVPLLHVFTVGIGNFADISFVVKDFKEEKVTVLVLDRKWVGNEAGFDVCDVFCAEYGVADTIGGKECDG